MQTAGSLIDNVATSLMSPNVFLLAPFFNVNFNESKRVARCFVEMQKIPNWYLLILILPTIWTLNALKVQRFLVSRHNAIIYQLWWFYKSQPFWTIPGLGYILLNRHTNYCCTLSIKETCHENKKHANFNESIVCRMMASGTHIDNQCINLRRRH